MSAKQSATPGKLAVATEGVLARLRRSSLTLLLGIESELKRKTRRLKFREDVDVHQLDDDASQQTRSNRQKLKDDTSSEDDSSSLTSLSRRRHRLAERRHIFSLEHCSVRRDVGNCERLRLLFALGVDFVNEKISVQASKNGRVVIINAQRYAPLGDGTQFLRVCVDKHTLPHAIDANKLYVCMDDEGCLLVEAPILPDDKP